MSTIVCKFGGTSVAASDMFRRVKSILREDADRRYVVLSAPGRRFPGDEKVTDLLQRCHAAPGKAAFDAAWERVRMRFLEIAEDLGLERFMEAWLTEAKAVARISPDAAASRGEYLCARLFAAFAGMSFLDAASLIRFDDRGALDAAATCRAVSAALAEQPRAVIPGFYGAAPDGTLRLLERGGSDVTGALIALGVSADLYENWTDVDGVYTADPARFPGARPVAEIGCGQMELLAGAGAGVLHRDAVPPLAEAGIPLVIRNTRAPSRPGTLVATGAWASSPCVSGIGGLLALLAPVQTTLRPAGKARLRATFPCAEGAYFVVEKNRLTALSEDLSGIDTCVPVPVGLVAVVWDPCSVEIALPLPDIEPVAWRAGPGTLLLLVREATLEHSVGRIHEYLRTL